MAQKTILKKSVNLSSVNDLRALADPSFDLGSLPSPALQRILDEVRNEESPKLTAKYNRMHNRHNR